MASDLTDSFAVVAYIGGEPARFVHDIRCKYTPGCPHRAHVTVLPPRPLSVTAEAAAEECGQILSRFDPFAVEITSVDLFAETQVVKLAIGEGASELRTLHDILNTGVLAHAENYSYTPHITLSMDLAERTSICFEQAKSRWAAYRGAKRFWVDRLTLVQQRSDEIWTDLAEIPVGDAQAQPVRARR